MPDWTHSILYLVIMTLALLLSAYYTASIWGLIAGLIIGHLLATAIITRLPGFWGR